MLRQISDLRRSCTTRLEQQSKAGVRLKPGRPGRAATAADMERLGRRTGSCAFDLRLLLSWLTLRRSACSRVAGRVRGDAGVRAAQDAGLGDGGRSRPASPLGCWCERDSLLRFKGELGIMRKKLAALLKDIDEQKDALKHSAEREDALLHAIAALDSRIAAQRASMADKDRAIADSERAIAELKKDNGELEKFKFVLDYQIKQLKRQIEPREADIARHPAGTSEPSTAASSASTRPTPQCTATSPHCSASNARRQSAVHRSRDATRSLQRRLAVARRRLAECTAALDEPRRLQAAFEALCRDVLLPPPQLQQQQQQQRASEPSASAPPSSSPFGRLCRGAVGVRPTARGAAAARGGSVHRAERRVEDGVARATWRSCRATWALIREVQRGRRPGPQPSQPQQPQPPHSRTAAQSSHPQRPSPAAECGPRRRRRSRGPRRTAPLSGSTSSARTSSR